MSLSSKIFKFIEIIVMVVFVILVIVDTCLIISCIEALLNKNIPSVFGCDHPIYTWLCFATISLLVAVATSNQEHLSLIGILNAILIIIVYIYGYEYYSKRDFCMNEDSEIIYNIMLAYLIIRGIFYIFAISMLILVLILGICGISIQILTALKIKNFKKVLNFRETNYESF